MIDGLFGGWAHFIVTKKKNQKRKTPCYGISQLHISYAVGCLLQIVRV